MVRYTESFFFLLCVCHEEIESKNWKFLESKIVKFLEPFLNSHKISFLDIVLLFSGKQKIRKSKELKSSFHIYFPRGFTALSKKNLKNKIWFWELNFKCQTTNWCLVLSHFRSVKSLE